MATGKRAVFIPLKIAQKNEQFHNAQEAQKQIPVEIIVEDDLSEFSLKKAVEKVIKQKVLPKSNLSFYREAVYKIVNEIMK